MDDMILEIRHLSKSFGSHEVLRDIDFTVNKGDVTSIIGSSGSGKSTLLRCINLLETPTCSRYCMAFFRAVSRSFFSTFTWPTTQFSSTVILLNRLKDWNTMPT